MISFREFIKKIYGEEIVGIYPPEYGGIGTYPPLANQTGPDQIYVKASRNSLRKHKRRKKKHKK